MTPGNPQPDDRAVFQPGTLADVFTELGAFFMRTGKLLHQLQDDPDDQTIQAALDALRTIRDMFDGGQILRRQILGVRNLLIGALVQATPKTHTLGLIAGAAGITDSMVTRIAREYGAAPRARRSRRPRPALAMR